MDNDTQTIIKVTPKSALAHARDVSTALKESARRARFSRRSKRGTSSDGFRAGRRAQIFSLMVWLSFALVFVIPSLTIASYYCFIASDQYISESQFTVAGGMAPTADGIGSLTGIPAIAIIQDTQIVTNYVTSRAAVEKLESNVDLRTLYSKQDIDFYARFNAKKPIEKLVKYWKNMVTASIKMPSGIVVLQVKAFSAQDAQRIAQSLVKDSERLINDMDERMHTDAVTSAEQQVTNASDRLADTRLALENARNNSGILDAVKTADAINSMLSNVRSALLQLQQEYQTQLKSVTPEAPQMRLLKSRIEATAAQIAELEAQITLKQGGNNTNAPLSSEVGKFAELDLEHKISERLYAGALTALEIARLTAQKRMMYLTTFIAPALPQDAEYPRRITNTLLASFVCLIAWGLVCLVISILRKRLI